MYALQNAQPLIFCNWYRRKSCCLPVHDYEISGLFQALIDAGESCAKFQNRAKYYLSLASCYGCDPDEPLHFTAPVDTAFFNATKSVKICASVAREMAPRLFSDCGLLLADDRNTICSPSSAIVPEYVWPDCADQQYVCQSNATNEWSCSDSPCSDEDTPLGFVNAPCNASELTCDGVLKFLNDNRAAKPVNYEAYPVEIIDEALCLHKHGDATKCRCLRAPSSHAARLSAVWRLSVAAVAFVTAFNAL